MHFIIKKTIASITAGFVVWQFILFASSLFVGCSPTARHRALSFFFDEVPPLSQPDSTTTIDSLKQTNDIHEIRADSTMAKQPVRYSHPSLEKSECKTCHDQKQLFRLFDVPENLCLSCHDQADAEIVHAPVETGECTNCHNPHGSENPYLLRLKGQELCFECHEQEEIKPSDAISLHAPLESGSCLDCHNPHGTKNPKMLVVIKEAICFLCHDNEEIRPSVAEFIHAPARTGACLDCHNPHSTKSPFMLAKPAEALCFQCHDEKVKTLESHEDIEDMVCYECHNPHSADNKYYLR